MRRLLLVTVDSSGNNVTGPPNCSSTRTGLIVAAVRAKKGCCGDVSNDCSACLLPSRPSGGLAVQQHVCHDTPHQATLLHDDRQTDRQTCPDAVTLLLLYFVYIYG